MRLATPELNQITIERYGATFHGRVVPQPEIKAIRERIGKPPAKEGDPLEVDETEFLLAMFDASVTGWSGLTDFQENEIPHSAGAVRKLEELNQGFANDVLMGIHQQATKLRRREEEKKAAKRKNS